MSAKKQQSEDAPMSAACAYMQLCKLRVNALILLTAAVGMFLATPYRVMGAMFASVWYLYVVSLLGIGLIACAAAAINHYVDARIDALMQRTKSRPMVVGSLSGRQTLTFAISLGIIGFVLLYLFVNHLCAWLTLLTLFGYAIVYTLYLKHATPMNIVIGGLAGAMPPLLGWVAIQGFIGLAPIFLVLIIFLWTPPHFWALAINRKDDYAKANVPMLPITHGVAFTKKRIVHYTWVMSAATLLPFVFGESGIVYLLPVLWLDFWFLKLAYQLKRDTTGTMEMRVFKYSIIYLMLLFIVLMVDHVLSPMLLVYGHHGLGASIVYMPVHWGGFFA